MYNKIRYNMITSESNRVLLVDRLIDYEFDYFVVHNCESLTATQLKFNDVSNGKSASQCFKTNIVCVKHRSKHLLFFSI